MSVAPHFGGAPLRSCRAVRHQIRSLSGTSTARQASPTPLPTRKTSTEGSSSGSWTPVLSTGVEPAYDEALKYIYANQAMLKDEVKHLRTKLEGLRGGDEGEAERLKERILSTEIASEVNDPKIRADFESGKADLTRPVNLHLHQLWWHRSILPRLLERVRLLRVVPDAIERLTARADLRVFFGTGSGYTDHSSDGGEVLTAAWVPARDTLQAPRVTVVPFHPHERLYTAILVDVDVPNEESGRLESWCHWLVRDVPISSGRTTLDAEAGRTVLPYIAPHPSNGGPERRTVLVLIDQSNANTSSETEEHLQRERFSIPQYLVQNGLSSLDVVAAQFWRNKWTKEDAEAISSVWAQRGLPEPKYGRQPSFNMYRDPQTGRLPSRYFRNVLVGTESSTSSE